jgi:hypothetical protein
MAELEKADSPERANSQPIDQSSPTHRIKNIKVGNNGVQLLVSTGNQLYDAEDVEAGDSAWQSVGTWNDEAFIKVAETIRQRQTQVHKAEAVVIEKSRDPTREGGRKLGTMQGLAAADRA